MNKSVITLLALGTVISAANAAITIGATNVAFVDISGTGTSVGTISDDSENTITGASLAGFAGNALLAGGVSVRVGNNGGIIWGTSATDTFTGADSVGYINSTTLGTMVASNAADKGNGFGTRQFLAPLWDDNFPLSGGTASTKYQVIGGDLYIQWTNQDHFNAQGTGAITYQVVIRASGPTLVDYVYQDTLYAANQYQNDGGSATIGYKNWGLNAFGNDVEYGIGGGTDSLSDPAFGGTNMQAKVSGWASAAGTNTHSVSITAVPEPASMTALALGAVAMLRRRKSSK